MAKVCVFQDWLFDLPMQQQSVLVLACRGPDGVGKDHPCKRLVAHYRASVLKAATHGRALQSGQDVASSSFMTLAEFADYNLWRGVLHGFFKSVDSLPHHYYMHLMHGAQIIGYKHRSSLFKQRWGQFYRLCCDDLHLLPETQQLMDNRLNDFGHEDWDQPELAQIGYAV